MPNRKIDKWLKFRQESSAPWAQPIHKIVPEKNGIKRAVPSFENNEDIHKKVLDPKIVTMRSVLETGTVIEPKGFANALGLTDPASLEIVRQQLTEKGAAWLDRNHDALINLLEK